MSKKRHNFFRLCSLVLAFMLTFTNMPAVAYATDGYSAEALVEDTAEASENDAITEDGEIEESEPASQVEEPGEETGDDEVIDEDVEPVVEEEEEVEEEVEAVEEEDSTLKVDDRFALTFWSSPTYKIQVSYVDKDKALELAEIPKPTEVGYVFDGWTTGPNGTGKYYSSTEISQLYMVGDNMHDWNFYALFEGEMNPAFTSDFVYKTYGDDTFTNAISNASSFPSNAVVKYSSANKNYATVDEDTGVVTIKGAHDNNMTNTEIKATLQTAHGNKIGEGSYELHIYQRSITVTPKDVTAVYNAQSHGGEAFDVTPKAGDDDLPYGDVIKATVNGTRTDVGEDTLKIVNTTENPIVITNGEGDDKRYVTGSYIITTGTGTVKITPATYTLTWGELTFPNTGDNQKPTVTAAGLYGDDAGSLEVKVYADADCTTPLTSYEAAGIYYARAELPTDIAKNYNTPANAVVQYEITGRAMDVTVTAEDPGSYPYDETNQALKIDVDYVDHLDAERPITGATVKYSLEKDGTYTTTLPDCTDIGEYTIYVKVEHHDYTTGIGSVTITVTPVDVTEITVALEGWTYLEAGPHLPTVTYNPADAATGAKPEFWYKKTSEEDNAYTKTQPILPGEYTIKAVVPAHGNYNAAEATNTFTIQKADQGTPSQVPVLSEGWTYDTTEKPLITTQGATATGIFKYYAIASTTEPTAPTDKTLFTEEVPTATNAGTYYVYYYIEGTDYYKDGDITKLGYVVVSKASHPENHVTVSGWTYGNNPSTPALTVVDPTATEVTFKVKKGTSGDYAVWGDFISASSHAGTYQVYAEIAETDNYSAYTTDVTEFSIAKKTLTIKLLTHSQPYGTSSAPADFPYDLEGRVGTDTLPTPTYAVQYYSGSTNVPITSTTPAGDYRVEISAATGGNDDYQFSANPLYWTAGTLTITKIDQGDATKDPIGQTGLGYTGAMQNLLSQYGESSYGTFMYSTTYKPGMNPEQGNFSSSMVYGQDAGTYNIYYYIAGDQNHNDKWKETPQSGFKVPYGPITVTITPAQSELLAPYPILQPLYTLHYNGEAHNLLVNGYYGNAKNGTVMFSYDFVDKGYQSKEDLEKSIAAATWYTGANLKATDVNQYEVYYYVKGNTNYANAYKESTSGYNCWKATRDELGENIDYTYINPAFLRIKANNVRVTYGTDPESYYTATITPMTGYYKEADEPLLGIKYNKASGNDVGTYKVMPTSVLATENHTSYYLSPTVDIDDSWKTYIVGNYLIYEFVEGTVTIEPAPVTVYVNDASKTYTGSEETDPEFTYTIEGLQYGESEAASKIVVPQRIRVPEGAELITPEEGVNADTTTDIELPYKNVLRVKGKDFSVTRTDGRLETPDNSKTDEYKYEVTHGTERQFNYMVTYVAGDFTILYDEIDLTAPAAIDGLVYSAEPQDLIDYGAADNGTIYYYVVDPDGTAPAAIGTADGWQSIGEVTAEEDKANLRRTPAGTYDVYYWVDGDVGFKDITGDRDGGVVKPLGPITVTIADGYAEIASDNDHPAAYLNLKYNEEEHALVTSGKPKNGTLNYAAIVCNHETEEHQKQYKPDDDIFKDKDGNSIWSVDVPKQLLPDTYDVYYYVKGAELGDGSKYLDSPVYGPITVTIAAVNAEVTTVPVARLNLAYNETQQKLVTDGAAINGNLKYAVVDCNHDIDEHKKIHTPDDDIFKDEGGNSIWSYDVPTKMSAGKYDVYYYVDGTEWGTGDEKRTDLKYISTPVSEPITVTIDDTYASVEKDPVFAEGLKYDTEPHALITEAGKAQYGTLYYSINWRSSEKADTPATKNICEKVKYEAIPQVKEPGYYDITYYVNGKEWGENQNAEYIWTDTFKATVTIADTYAYIDEEPVFLENQKYDAAPHDLITTAGVPVYGTLYYSVKYRKTEDAEATEFCGDVKFEEIPQATKPGFYDIYYYVNGKEWGENQNAEYIWTDTFKETVIIADEYAKFTAKPTAKDLTYKGPGQTQPLLETAGTGVYGTIKYIVWEGEGMPAKTAEGWTTTVPTAIEAGTYHVYSYVDGSVLGTQTGLLYVDSDMESYEVTIAKREQWAIDPNDNKPIDHPSIVVINEGKENEESVVTTTIGSTIELDSFIKGYTVGTRSFKIKSDTTRSCKLDEESGKLVIGAVTGEIVVNIAISGDSNNEPYNRIITIKIKGQSSGTEDGTFEVTFVEPDDYDDDGTPLYIYTGAPINPQIVVTNGDDTMIYGIDYKVSYKNNKMATDNPKNKAGLAKVVVQGIGNYKDKVTLEFRILRADLSKAEVGNKVVIFGKKIEPVVTYKGLVLKSGTDFDYVVEAGSYADPKAAVNSSENQTYKIIGKGNFDADSSNEFNVEVIAKEQIKSFVVTFAKDINKKFVYNGEPIEVTVGKGCDIEIKDKAKKDSTADEAYLDVNDYNISFSKDLINAGKVTVTITGQNWYKGKVTKTITINPAKNAVVTLTPECIKAIQNQGVPFRNVGATPAIELEADLDSDHTGVGLILGTDYKVTYSNNKKAEQNGKYKVTFIGNYKGHAAISGQFKINKAVFDSAKTVVSVAGQFYYKGKNKTDKASKYFAKPGTNLFVMHDGVLLKNSEYTVNYYYEKDLEKKIDKDAPVEVGTKIYVAVVPKDLKNYTIESDTVIWADEPYVIVPAYNKTTEIDLSKAKITIIDKDTGKTVKPGYTGVAVTPGYDANGDVDPDSKYRLRLTIGSGSNALVFTSDGREYQKGNKDGIAAKNGVIPDGFNVTFVNNVRRGTARIIIDANGATYDNGSKTFVGTMVRNFTIGQSPVKTWLENILGI